MALGVCHNLAIMWSEPDADDLQDMLLNDAEDQDDQDLVGMQDVAGNRAAGQAFRDWMSDQFC